MHRCGEENKKVIKIPENYISAYWFYYKGNV